MRCRKFNYRFRQRRDGRRRGPRGGGEAAINKKYVYKIHGAQHESAQCAVDKRPLPEELPQPLTTPKHVCVLFLQPTPLGPAEECRETRRTAESRERRLMKWPALTRAFVSASHSTPAAARRNFMPEIDESRQ
ncbi:hypothetical protein EVAR_23686_1 [Eumeta japonica]|uniref:Uncharacterized protein n=1 Tax=Eumeta variegata TaxID=151549 RepID=A0A4C1VIR4_EUMVA|nr:hypothetical protein EVAR_23686_1 [Eumeta japonica]